MNNSIGLNYINIDENILGTSTTFGGNQFNFFTELNYTINTQSQNINIGLNTLADKFTEDNNQSERDQEYQTFGLYINHLWDVNKKFALESGLMRVIYYLSQK